MQTQQKKSDRLNFHQTCNSQALNRLRLDLECPISQHEEDALKSFEMKFIEIILMPVTVLQA